MSKVLLVVGAGLDQRAVDIELRLNEEEKILGIIRTDHDVNDKGERQTSPDIDPVIYIGYINHLTGKLLTLADASFNDIEQRNAFKDLIKQTTWNWYSSHGDTLGFAFREWRGSDIDEADVPGND